MIEKIEILQHGKNCDFGCYSGEEAWWLLCIVAYHHQLVVQLGEDRLNSLSVPLVSPQRRPPVLLVQAGKNFKNDVCLGKQVLLYGIIQISFVAKQTGQIPALINKIGNCIRTLAGKTGKEIVLTVNTEYFHCVGKCHNIQMGASGNDTTARNISSLVNLIFCLLLAGFKNFSDLCDEVAHSNDIVT